MSISQASYRKGYPSHSPNSYIPQTPVQSPDHHRPSEPYWRNPNRVHPMTPITTPPKHASRQQYSNRPLDFSPGGKSHIETSEWSSQSPTLHAPLSQNPLTFSPQAPKRSRSSIYVAPTSFRGRIERQQPILKRMALACFFLLCCMLWMLSDGSSELQVVERQATAQAAYKLWGSGEIELARYGRDNATALLHDIPVVPDWSISPPMQVLMASKALSRYVIIPVESNISVTETTSILSQLSKIPNITLHLVIEASYEQDLLDVLRLARLSSQANIITLDPGEPLLSGTIAEAAVLPNIELQQVIISPSMSELSRESNLVDMIQALCKTALVNRHEKSPPLGITGARISPSHLEAVKPPANRTFRDLAYPAAFVLPPFLVRGELLEKVAMGMPQTDVGVWSSFGLSVARHNAGIGGAVLRGVSFRSVIPRKTDFRPQLESSFASFIEGYSTPEMPYLDHYAILRNRQARSSVSLSYPLPPAAFGNVLLMASDAYHLTAMSDMACNLIRSGHSVTMTLVIGGRVEDEAQATHAGLCHLHYQTVLLTTIQHALLSKDTMPDIIIIPEEVPEEHAEDQSGVPSVLSQALARISEIELTPSFTMSISPTDLTHVAALGTLDLVALRNWQLPRIDILLQHKGTVYDSAEVVNHLSKQVGGNGHVDLTLVFDRPPARQVELLIRQMAWAAGNLHIRYLESPLAKRSALWHPVDENHYMVLLRDDLVLDTSLYSWLLTSLLDARYSSRSTQDPRSAGIVLGPDTRHRESGLLPQVVHGEMQEIGLHYPGAWLAASKMPSTMEARKQGSLLSRLLSARPSHRNLYTSSPRPLARQRSHAARDDRRRSFSAVSGLNNSQTLLPVAMLPLPAELPSFFD